MDVKSEVVYKLIFPVTQNGEPLTSITFKRPKGKHIKHLPMEPNTEELMSVASKISGVLPTTFDEMDIADYTAVSNIIGNFFMNSQVTGVSS